MKILELLRNEDPRYKGHLWFFLIAYFFVLFNYPLVRAASTTMFFEEFGAKSSPVAWIFTVVVLTGTIFIFNKLQATHSVQKVLLWVSLVSTGIFALSTLGYISHIKYATFLSFIWKEICIVLQVHLMLAYANNFFSKEDFRKMIGPVGAVGSVGGILGGLLTTYISKKFGTTEVSWIALVFVFLPALLFLKTKVLKNEGQETAASPMASLNTPTIRSYVLHVALIVMLSQFIINIADFKFNLAFEQSIIVSSDRTAYLGTVYTWTNLISLLLQFILLPLLLPRITEKTLHLFIPLSYLLCLVGLIFSGALALLPVAMFYTYLKASDYSLFSAGKELLYQTLLPEQKYGAKYLTDMLVYRYSKALIAAVLIYLQTSFILNVMMTGFLFLWLILVIRIFGIHRRLFN
jgi:ATP:ADP antiporter, AAA family